MTEPQAEDAVDIPDGWDVEVENVRTVFEHESGEFEIHVTQIGDDYFVELFRKLSASGYEAMVPTFGRRTTSVDEASTVIDDALFDDPVNLGSVTAIEAERVETDGVSVVQFYTVFEETLPDEVDVSDLTFDPDAGGIGTTSAFGLDEDDLDDDHVPIRVDIYPVHISEVTEVETSD